MRITGGALRGREVRAPKGSETRPSSSRLREAVYNMCQQEVAGARVLDLFSGSGVMGLEALSRGAVSCLFVDSSKEAVRAIRDNVKRLGVRGDVVQRDVLGALNGLKGRQFDLIYADPPYRDREVARAVIEKIAAGDFLANRGHFFVEFGEELTISFDNLKLVKIKRYESPTSLRNTPLNIKCQKDQ